MREASLGLLTSSKKEKVVKKEAMMRNPARMRMQTWTKASTRMSSKPSRRRLLALTYLTQPEEQEEVLDLETLLRHQMRAKIKRESRRSELI